MASLGWRLVAMGGCAGLLAMATAAAVADERPPGATPRPQKAAVPGPLDQVITLIQRTERDAGQGPGLLTALDAVVDAGVGHKDEGVRAAAREALIRLAGDNLEAAAHLASKIGEPKFVSQPRLKTGRVDMLSVLLSLDCVAKEVQALGSGSGSTGPIHDFVARLNQDSASRAGYDQLVALAQLARKDAGQPGDSPAPGMLNVLRSLVKLRGFDGVIGDVSGVSADEKRGINLQHEIALATASLALRGGKQEVEFLMGRLSDLEGRLREQIETRKPTHVLQDSGYFTLVDATAQVYRVLHRVTGWRQLDMGFDQKKWTQWWASERGNWELSGTTRAAESPNRALSLSSVEARPEAARARIVVVELDSGATYPKAGRQPIDAATCDLALKVMGVAVQGQYEYDRQANANPVAGDYGSNCELAVVMFNTKIVTMPFGGNIQEKAGRVHKARSLPGRLDLWETGEEEPCSWSAIAEAIKLANDHGGPAEIIYVGRVAAVGAGRGEQTWLEEARDRLLTPTQKQAEAKAGGSSITRRVARGDNHTQALLRIVGARDAKLIGAVLMDLKMYGITWNAVLVDPTHPEQPTTPRTFAGPEAFTQFNNSGLTADPRVVPGVEMMHAVTRASGGALTLVIP